MLTLKFILQGNFRSLRLNNYYSKGRNVKGISTAFFVKCKKLSEVSYLTGNCFTYCML